MMLVLRLLHVGCAIFWGGSVLFLNLLLGPAAAAAGIDGFAVMRELAKRRMMDIMLGVGLVVILSGLELVRRDSANFSPSWFHTGMGVTISIAMVATLVGFLVALIGIKPANRAMGVIGARIVLAPAEQRGVLLAEMSLIRSRLIRFSMIGVVCMLIAIAAMAIFRYV